METRVAVWFEDNPQVAVAEKVLAQCVHCGFCNATCPTYQLLGDELDGPRGRIYQMKMVVEGEQASNNTLMHLDRCLLCRSCETTCPSGVQYATLLEAMKPIVESQAKRPLKFRLKRKVVRDFITSGGLINGLIGLGQRARPLLPVKLKKLVPARQKRLEWPRTGYFRKMLVLGGCVQSTIAPRSNGAAASILDKLGINLIEINGGHCCGAVQLHNGSHAKGLDHARRIIDLCNTWMSSHDIEGIVMTASGCGVTVKQYAELLKDDPEYADKAATVSALCKDLIEVVAEELLQNPEKITGFKPTKRWQRVAFHPPCTLQHGQQIRQRIETLLQKLGYELCQVPDSHLCCGSAGTYSIMQPAIAEQLRREKMHNLLSDEPQVIASANIGCQVHLAQASSLPVIHWAELLLD